MALPPRVAILFICLLVVQAAHAQSTGGCKTTVSYEDRNQVDPSPLTLTKASGIAEDNDKVRIPDVCLALFAEVGHKLIAQTSTNEDGYFDFGYVSPGRYRLVARYDSFCTSNTPVLIPRQATKNRRGQKRIVIHMMPAAIDRCSYGDYR